MTDPAVPSPEELYRDVRRLRLSVLRQVRTRLAGAYASAFRGVGMEFEEFAVYQPGDDVRHIDWQVTARRRQPHVKRFREERQLRVVLALDVSRSMDGGGNRRRALRVTAALALSAASSGDRVGGMLFSDRVLATVPPRSGEKHALNFLRRALDAPDSAVRTDLRPVLRHVRNLRGHAVVVLLSDFLCEPDPWDPAMRTLLSACARKHDLLAVRFTGPPPEALPVGVIVRAAEAESGRRLRLNAFGAGATAWKDALERHVGFTRRALLNCGARVLELAPGEKQVARLMEFLERMPPRHTQ